MLIHSKKLLKLDKQYSLPPVMDNLLLSSAFNSVYVTAYITNITERHKEKNKLFESDFSALLAAILPHYFEYTKGWVIAPEIWSNDKRKSDLVVFLPNTIQNSRLRYGEPVPHLMCESKLPSGIPWKDLVKEQLWNQASTVSEDYGGKLWVIGQIGFFICIFRFDLVKYNDSLWFTNFSPLNINNFTEQDLDYLEIKYIMESNSNNENILQVIQWDLRETSQYRYIDEMLLHITRNDP